MSRKDEKWEEAEKYVLERAGRRLPGERELAQEFGVSRPRLRSMLAQLERDGKIERRQGSGTYALRSGDSGLKRVVLLLDATFKLGDDPFISRLVDQLQGALQNAGIQCFIQRTASQASGADAHFNSRALWPRHDGVIALGLAGHELLQAEPGLKPSVALFADSRTRPGRTLSLLQFDDEDAGAQAARKLVRKGCTSLCFFGRPELPAVRDRLKGIRSEVENAGIPVEVVACGMNYGAGFEQGVNYILPKAPTGLIAANDWLAVGLQAGLQSKNPDWRRHIHLVSFDGLPFAKRPELSIESLEVPLETIVADAIVELQRLQKNAPEAAKTRRIQHSGRAVRYGAEWPGQGSDDSEETEGAAA